jgi:crossover junction endodeoxyribonuclease RusA
MMVAELNVPGLPASQGSHSAYVNKKTMRAVVLHGSSNVQRARLAAWRGAVSGEAKRWMQKHRYAASPWDRSVPLRVTIIFRLPQPKARPTIKLHERRPDLDKLVRSTLDGLTTSGLIVDDSRISVLIAAKRWQLDDEPGAEIFVTEAIEDDMDEVYACWSA